MPIYTTYDCQSCGKHCVDRPNTRGLYCSVKCMMYHRRTEKVESGKADKKTISRYLKERNIYECVECDNDGTWQGNHLPLHLDHIDGNRKNNLIENLRWLCPYCHQQTDTWGVKNIKLDKGVWGISSAGRAQRLQR